MEQTENIEPEGATGAPALPAARLSERLSPALVEPALDAGRDRRRGRAQRSDGWTPERIRLFLDTLAECGVVMDAARAAGMSVQSAYNLRNRPAGEAFHIAWDAAELLGRRRVSADALSRTIHGCVDVIVRDGKVWGERHHYDNRLTMAVLTRLDRKAASLDRESRTAQVVAGNFHEFVDLVCDGGAGAAEFIAQRQVAEDGGARPTAARGSDEAVPAWEIDLSDLDPTRIAHWSEEQRDRARRAGLGEEVFAAAESGDESERRRFRVTVLPPNPPSERRFFVRESIYPTHRPECDDPAGTGRIPGAQRPPASPAAFRGMGGDEWQP
jgi:hypothetical protein